MRNIRNMKGQFWSLDVIFAITIFGVAIVLLTFVWFNISSQYSTATGFGVEGMQQELNNLGTTLMTQGVPSNWNSVVNVTNTQTWSSVSIGIGGSAKGSVSVDKLMTLYSMSSYKYQSTKALLGIGYDYYISISNPQLNIGIGLKPINATAIQVENIPVVVAGTPSRMQLIIWTNTTFGVE